MSNRYGRRRTYKSGHQSHHHENLDRDTLLRELNFDRRPLRFSLLCKPIYFTVVFSTFIWLVATEWRDYCLANAKQKKTNQKYYNEVTVLSLTNVCKSIWNDLSDAEKIFIPIFAVNLLVFAMWRMAQYQPFMLRLFCQTPANPNICWPMILSIFSHFSPFHFISNMYTLLSFTKAAARKLTKEQFLCLYLISGVVSSLASYIYKIYLDQPGLSLGASGAVMGILGYVCTEFPKTSVGIIYLPFYAIPSSQAIKVILALNVIGMITGGSCDYAAHLGGIIFGMLWSHFLSDII